MTLEVKNKAEEMINYEMVMLLLLPAKEVWGKVIPSQVSVHGGGGCDPWERGDDVEG